MPKLNTITVRVEEAAFGKVVNTLNSMPGVVELDLHLSPPKKGAAGSSAGASVRNGTALTLTALSKGAKTAKEIAEATQLTATKVHGSLYYLRKQKLVKGFRVTAAGKKALTEANNG